MEIIFRTNYDGVIYTATEKMNDTLKKMGVKENDIKVAMEVAENLDVNIFDALKNNVMWIALPLDKIGDKNYVLTRAIYVLGKDAKVIITEHGVLSAENGDRMFTARFEAEAIVEAHNNVEKLIKEKSDHFKAIRDIDKEIENEKKNF